jgi:hypothetical protein
MFQVIEVETSSVVAEVNSADEAKALIESFKISSHKKYRIARNKNAVDWRKREEGRLKDGTYKPLPDWWDTETRAVLAKDAVKDHFAHLSADGCRIAYTPDAEYGVADRQRVVSVTTYLGRFYNHLYGNEIAAIDARLQSGDYILKTSYAPEDFERAYSKQEVCNEDSSCPSCMRYDKQWFKTEVHPAYVYGAGDLMIAWIEDKNDPNIILGRSVVYPKAGGFVRVYGSDGKHQAILKQLLQSEGYRQINSYHGARMLKVRNDIRNKKHGVKDITCYVFPYLDGESGLVRDDGEYFVIDDHNGEFESGAGGWIEIENVVTCERTGRRIIARRAVTVITATGAVQTWDEHYAVTNATYCRLSGRYYEDASDFVAVHWSYGYGGQPNAIPCHPSALEGKTFICALSGLRFSNDSEMGILVDREGEHSFAINRQDNRLIGYTYCTRGKKWYKNSDFRFRRVNQWGSICVNPFEYIPSLSLAA